MWIFWQDGNVRKGKGWEGVGVLSGRVVSGMVKLQ